jgi:hypothetical protein
MSHTTPCYCAICVRQRRIAVVLEHGSAEAKNILIEDLAYKLSFTEDALKLARDLLRKAEAQLE